MNLQQQQSVLTIAMLAAFADGAKDDTEREEIRRIAQSLAAEGNMPDLPRLYQDVLLRRTSLESAAAALQDPTHRQLAYEMAVCVCDVDGRQTPTEREFLAHLKQTLQLGSAATDAFDQEEQALLNALDSATATSTSIRDSTAPKPRASRLRIFIFSSFMDSLISSCKDSGVRGACLGCRLRPVLIDEYPVSARHVNAWTVYA